MTLRWPWIAGLVVGLAALLLGLMQPEDAVRQWQLAARWTARVGFPFLVLVYVARPLTQLWKSEFSKGLLKRRKYFGLGLATCHTIHLYALYTALAVAGQDFTPAQLVAGGGAYAIMYVMAFTSNAAAIKALGKWWKRIHRVGVHWLWVVFAFTYLRDIAEPEKQAYSISAFAMAMGAALIRFLAWQQTRRKRKAARAL